ncbi:hypothetical protein BGW42_005465 [Actinomortierella wolfii]|nr:hypothetical protein BGW42_005465 [Actinomortierella wolfii]
MLRNEHAENTNDQDPAGPSVLSQSMASNAPVQQIEGDRQSVVSKSTLSSSKAVQVGSTSDLVSKLYQVQLVDGDSSNASRILKRMEQHLPNVKFFQKTIETILRTLKMAVYRPDETDPEFIKTLKKLYTIVAKLSSSGLALVLDCEEIRLDLFQIRQELSKSPYMSSGSAAEVSGIDATENADYEAMKLQQNKLKTKHDKARKLFENFGLRSDVTKKFFLAPESLTMSDNEIASDEISKTFEGTIIGGHHNGEKFHVKVYTEIESGDVTVITQRVVLLTHLLRICDNIARPRFAIPSEKKIIMDPIMHMTLDKVLEEKDPNMKLSNVLKVDVALTIAGALALVHSFNIIHRNLCASNVLITVVTKDDREVCLPKLTGFEICRFLDKEYSIGQKRPGSVMNAPEIKSGYGHSVYTDVYSFGVLMYQISMGELPNMRDQWVTKEDVDEWHSHEFGCLSESYSKLMRLCLDSDYKSRPTMKEVAEKLATIASELSDE